MRRDTVTPYQIYNFIVEFRRQHPYGPSVKQIAEAIGKGYYNTLRIIRTYQGKLWTRTPRVNGSINVLPLENVEDSLLTDAN